MRKKGKIVKWNSDKGFGFIRPFDSKQDIFIHITSIQYRKTPAIGHVITYTQSKDKNGRPCAIDAVLAGDKRVIRKKKDSNKGLYWFALLYLTSLIILSVIGIAPIELVILIFGLSLFTYILFSSDKSRAKSGGWRIEEANLKLFSLVGGWPGALIAQQRLRHKSAKKEFIYTLWGAIVVNIIFTIWLISPKGKPFLLEAIRLIHSL